MWRALKRGGGWVGATVLALAVACGESSHSISVPAQAGAAGSSGSVSGGSGGSAGSGGQLIVTTAGQPSFLDACAGIAPRSPLNRWSMLDLDQTLDAWFGPGPTLASVAPRDYKYSRSVAPTFVHALLGVAQERVVAAVADDAVFELCDAGADDQPTCAQAWLRDWGARLYRRPLTSEQVEAYVAQFRTVSRQGTPAGAARNALISMLLSPYFVLRLEMGEAKSAGGLAPFEAAARLSHFATRRAPDAALAARAAADQLREPDQLKPELRRLWSTPEGQQGRVLTQLEWLGIRQDNERQDLDAALRADMATQVRTLVGDVLQSQTPTLESLLTRSNVPLNERLATHYGLRPPDGSGFQRSDLDPALFAGALSTGAFLSRFPRPTARGVQILEALLCDEAPPPPNIEPPLPDGATPRARITASVGVAPQCAGCHDIFDPIGFALEAFDDQGRLTGFDSSGALSRVAGVDPTQVANPGALGAALALSATARNCAARRYLEFALDREVPVTSIALTIPTPGSPGSAPIPIPTDPDRRWLDCLMQVSDPTTSFNFTQVGEALASSGLMFTRADPSRRVVAFDTSPDPLEHAARETAQFRGVFSNPDDEAVIQQYQQALLQELASAQLAGRATGEGGAAGEAADAPSPSGGAGGAP